MKTDGKCSSLFVLETLTGFNKGIEVLRAGQQNLDTGVLRARLRAGLRAGLRAWHHTDH